MIYKDFADKHKAQQAKIESMEREFAQRTESLNKLHQISLENQKAQLIKSRDDAIELADKDAANQIQSQIDEINAQSMQNNLPPVQQSADAQVVNSWNAANPWIMGAEPKAAYAKQQFSLYQNQGYPASQAIAAMEADVSRAFPSVNPRRERHPMPEGGTKPGSKGAKSLSMSDLTPEERMSYKMSSEGWGSEAEFLKAVLKARKGEK